MTRIARIIVPDLPHHMTARGNRREVIFRDDTDRHTYLDLLASRAGDCEVDFHAWCLMDNHVHLVMIPRHKNALADLMRRVQTGYATYFNRRYGLTGRMWESRYFTCPLDQDHFWAAVRYVEANPVRAGLVRDATAYRWSSAASHCGQNQSLLPLLPLPENDVEDWGAWLSVATPEADQTIKRQTEKERPAGDDAFLRHIGSLLGRDLSIKRRGRPAKSKK